MNIHQILSPGGTHTHKLGFLFNLPIFSGVTAGWPIPKK